MRCNWKEEHLPAQTTDCTHGTRRRSRKEYFCVPSNAGHEDKALRFLLGEGLVGTWNSRVLRQHVEPKLRCLQLPHETDVMLIYEF